MTIRMLVVTSLLCFGPACGGADSPAPAAPTPAPAAEAEPQAHEHGEGHKEGGEDHDHAFPAEVTAFHDVLSPNWHAEKGPARVDATCGAIASMTERAIAVKDSPAPDGVDAAEWTAIGEAMVQSVADLDSACDAEGRPDFDAAFTALHDAFHAFVDILKKN